MPKKGTKRALAKKKIDAPIPEKLEENKEEQKSENESIPKVENGRDITEKENLTETNEDITSKQISSESPSKASEKRNKRGRENSESDESMEKGDNNTESDKNKVAVTKNKPAAKRGRKVKENSNKELEDQKSEVDSSEDNETINNNPEVKGRSTRHGGKSAQTLSATTKHSTRQVAVVLKQVGIRKRKNASPAAESRTVDKHFAASSNDYQPRVVITRHKEVEDQAKKNLNKNEDTEEIAMEPNVKNSEASSNEEFNGEAEEKLGKTSQSNKKGSIKSKRGKSKKGENEAKKNLNENLTDDKNEDTEEIAESSKPDEPKIKNGKALSNEELNGEAGEESDKNSQINKKGSDKSSKRGKSKKGENEKKAKIEESVSKDSSSEDEVSDVQHKDFHNDSKTKDGNKWNFKIASWNVNGIRAWLEKDGLSYIQNEQPDILCIQETKCSVDKLPSEVKVKGYHSHFLAGDKDGYSGVGLLSKIKPMTLKDGIGKKEHDAEGRVITAEYEEFYLVTAYIPNSGRGLPRLDYRKQWDKDFLQYLKNLDKEKPVILAGDLNVAHEEIDLANPKTNKRNAGFTKEERDGFSTLLSENFVDSFRYLYPEKKDAYTFWTYMKNARAKNVGWRLDYFVLSERFVEPHLCDSVMRSKVLGSDHCPVVIFLNI